MNITQYRNKLKKYWDLDFCLWKETCYIIYKWQMIISCDRHKNDQYSFSTLDEEMLIKEMKYVDNIWDIYKIITVILHPVRGYRRFKHYWTI